MGSVLARGNSGPESSHIKGKTSDSPRGEPRKKAGKDERRSKKVSPIFLPRISAFNPPQVEVSAGESFEPFREYASPIGFYSAAQPADLRVCRSEHRRSKDYPDHARVGSVRAVPTDRPDGVGTGRQSETIGASTPPITAAINASTQCPATKYE
jgi:hypothetical protein